MFLGYSTAGTSSSKAKKQKQTKTNKQTNKQNKQKQNKKQNKTKQNKNKKIRRRKPTDVVTVVISSLLQMQCILKYFIGSLTDRVLVPYGENVCYNLDSEIVFITSSTTWKSMCGVRTILSGMCKDYAVLELEHFEVDDMKMTTFGHIMTQFVTT